ncbi:MAG: hypothetical protein MZU84_03530 [Sphingobacterium sp.]|nr:hypothetical protein [Sphingobacterium sp.]
METTLETTNSQYEDKTFSPAEVRKLLNADNKEIQRLCKEVECVSQKDNSSGRIFFFEKDVEVLQNIKNLYDKSQKSYKK